MFLKTTLPPRSAMLGKIFTMWPSEGIYNLNYSMRYLCKRNENMPIVVGNFSRGDTDTCLLISDGAYTTDQSHSATKGQLNEPSLLGYLQEYG